VHAQGRTAVIPGGLPQKKLSMRCQIIGLIVILAVGLLSAPLAAETPPGGKIPRLGVLVLGPPERSALAPFHQGLQDLGYVEGKTIALAYRFAEGKAERLPALAAELVGRQVDLIVAYAFQATRAAQQATQTLPIVMVDVGRDPVEAGLVASLARPGGNVTGLVDLGMRLHGKRLELLQEVVPRGSRVAALFDGSAPGQRRLPMHEAAPAARALGLTIQAWEVHGTEDFARVFAALTAERPDALYVAGSPLMTANRQRIADFAFQSRLPSVYEWRAAVEAGGLMSYGPSRADLSHRAATYVDKILKGAKPADLPVEQPIKFELVLNLKTAQALGLPIPPTLLFQADEVIR
jgi:putative ABC transport system substrate-binding protein